MCSNSSISPTKIRLWSESEHVLTAKRRITCSFSDTVRIRGTRFTNNDFCNMNMQHNIRLNIASHIIYCIHIFFSSSLVILSVVFNSSFDDNVNSNSTNTPNGRKNVSLNILVRRQTVAPPIYFFFSDFEYVSVHYHQTHCSDILPDTQSFAALEYLICANARCTWNLDFVSNPKQRGE